MVNSSHEWNTTDQFLTWTGDNMTSAGNITEQWQDEVTTASTSSGPVVDEADDAIWILSSTFIIFTMQSGFGLLESGSVTTKNEVNIMIKNAADVIFGGLTYWMFGYSFSFGPGKYRNAFNGWGQWFVAVPEHEIGQVYSKFFFQSSFATTATTIVSGAMAERTKLESYIIFSLLNTLVFCFPAHWVWDEYGWLFKMGMVDVAGAGPVHLVGGVTGLVATMMLKPRHGRYNSKYPPPMGSPTNALLGMFMLWWGWLGFNCGSTFGISGYKWKLAARSAMATLVATVSGGMASFGVSYIVKRRKFDVVYIINGILGSLVGITAFCALADPWESFVIGIIGSLLSLMGVELLDKLKIDDPVGVVGVHGVAGIWSLLAVGLFAKEDSLGVEIGYEHVHGAFYGGGFYLFGVQLLGAVSLIGWTAMTSYILLKIIDLTLGLRVPLQQEILGADLVEHAVGDIVYDKAKGTVVEMHKGRNNICRDDNQGDQPKFNEARKRRRSTKTDSSIQSIVEMSAMALSGGLPNEQNYPNGPTLTANGELQSNAGREERSHYYKTMWRFAVGKTLNADEKKKRNKVERNFSKLYRNHHKLKRSKRKGSITIHDDVEGNVAKLSDENYDNHLLARNNVGFIGNDEKTTVSELDETEIDLPGISVDYSHTCGTGIVHQERRPSPVAVIQHNSQLNMEVISTYI